ncbi:MAG TPA: SMC-Scp complex subunit ScpB [Clostridia bacterium]
MRIERLCSVIEAILFLAGEPVKKEDIMTKLNISPEDMEQAVSVLEKKYSGACGIHILKFNNKLQFSTNPDVADEVSAVLNPIKEKELSRSCLETLAIIAYKQPITRLEVEQIRGVNSEYAFSVLAQHGLIEVVGRKDVIGKPMLFGTTDEFLKRFQLTSLEDLPDYDELLERISVIENTKEDMLYKFDKDFDLPEEEVPDFLKELDDIKKIN